MMDQPRYEILDERFERSIKQLEPVERLWTGGKWVEGPVYIPAARCLVWSDIPNDRRLRWDELTGAVGDYASGRGFYTNGSCLDRQGRMICCEHGTRRVTRQEHDGTITVLADRFEGRRFNSPNDVVVRSDGTVWFSDPAYGVESDYEGFKGERELDGQHVYRLNPDNGEIMQVTTDFKRPNGLAFSLDEQWLYIVDSCGNSYPSNERHIRKFRVEADGTLRGGDVFADCTFGVFDGLRIDDRDRIWTSAGDGVHCYENDGTLVGKVLVPEAVSNLCFGGLKRNRLFITASTSLYSVLLPTSGAKLF